MWLTQLVFYGLPWLPWNQRQAVLFDLEARRFYVFGLVLRTRVLVYAGVLLLITTAVSLSIAMRSPFKVDVVRDRGALARIVDDGWIENVYRLQLMNATESTHRYTVRADGLDALALTTPVELALAPVEARWVSVALRVPPGTAERTGAGAHAIHFTVERLADTDAAPATVREKSTFVVPR